MSAQTKPELFAPCFPMLSIKKSGIEVDADNVQFSFVVGLGSIDCDVAHVDFWLFPTPVELTKDWDDREQLIDMVEKIDIRERLTTVVIERDEAIIQKIKDKIPHCQEYYAKLFAERSKGVKAA